MKRIEDQIKDEQVQQIIIKLSFFEELVQHIKNTGKQNITIQDTTILRDSYREQLVRILSDNFC